tara:strand:- start:350 stop:586 length:237 start_codon:yes stop_codon:yes gene_type:complete
MPYKPCRDDYVIWDTHPNPLEGWVYFVDTNYITIEIGVKCKDDENIKDCPLHKKYHCLVVCYPQDWHQLKYVKNRREE